MQRLFNNMDLTLMMVMWTLVAMTAALPRCDPYSQYVKGDKCCNMCGKGTRMQDNPNCEDPVCADCQQDEYQDKYTTETKCQRQPVCDPNKNFEVPFSRNLTARNNCMCKAGFHCADKLCITCVPHKHCEPGFGAQSIGDHLHNTVCESCIDGTFSEDHSWYATCKPWKKCGFRYYVREQGTATSDNVCGYQRIYIGVIIAAVGFLIILLAIALVKLYQHLKGPTKENKQIPCDQATVPLNETTVQITNPTDEEESYLPEQQSSQEEAGMRTPEENEDELSQEISADPVLTENGNLVTQENGKTSIISRQESQTPFTD